MMDHVAEVKDLAVRDAVDLFEAQIELLLLNLLDPDHDTAIAQITTARDRADDRIIKARPTVKMPRRSALRPPC
jgi:hypothetical protein